MQLCNLIVDQIMANPYVVSDSNNYNNIIIPTYKWACMNECPTPCFVSCAIQDDDTGNKIHLISYVPGNST